MLRQNDQSPRAHFVILQEITDAILAKFQFYYAQKCEKYIFFSKKIEALVHCCL